MIVTSQIQETDIRLPIYQRLRDLFVQKIQSGQWSGAAAIPSEAELALEHGVAPGTVRKAIESLVGEGYLVRHQGRGTFVRQANFGNALFRFFRHTDESGQVVKPVSKILSITTCSPSAHESGVLGLQPTDSVIRIERLRSVSQEPWIFEQISVGATRFAPLLSADRASFGDLLYPIYDRVCNVRVHRATETISFGFADEHIANNLQTKRAQPVAIIARLAYGIEGSPVEWRLSYGLASRFSYSIELK